MTIQVNTGSVRMTVEVAIFFWPDGNAQQPLPTLNVPDETLRQLMEFMGLQGETPQLTTWQWSLLQNDMSSQMDAYNARETMRLPECLRTLEPPEGYAQQLEWDWFVIDVEDLLDDAV